MKKSHVLILITVASLLAAPVFAKESFYAKITHAFTADPQTVPTKGSQEVAFSPKDGATELVVKVINSARQSIRLAAYSFTSKPIARALVDAHKRGVDVEVVVDKSQKSERYTSATFLANMGIPVRVDSMHAIMHNKFIVVDGQDVENGSFNYTSAAENRNAENALVNWNNPKLAAIYTTNWQEHWDHSEPYQARF
jgi:phosphatidylserine/phosphatidylglycerophosphate/cardiolipin synthase-like enzyme